MHVDINPYPNKWHKFLTGVLIRAVNRQKLKRLWVRAEMGSTTSTLQRCTWTLNGPGGKMAVACPAPCPIAADMAHDWLWVEWGHLGGHVTMRWMRGPLLTTKESLSYLISQCEDKRAISIHELSESLGTATSRYYSENIICSKIDTFTKIGEKNRMAVTCKQKNK